MTAWLRCDGHLSLVILSVRCRLYDLVFAFGDDCAVLFAVAILQSLK